MPPGARPVFIWTSLNLAAWTLILLLWSIDGGCAARAGRRGLLQTTSRQIDYPAKAMAISAVIRLAGPDFVPFTVDIQRTLYDAFLEILIPQMGPVFMVTYREGIPDPRAIDYPWENKPYTDVIGAFFALISSNTVVWEPDTQTMNTAFSNALKKGNWSRANHSIRLLTLVPQPVMLEGPVGPLPLIVFQAVLSADLADPSSVGGVLIAEQATLLSVATQDALVNTSSLVRVQEWNTSYIQATLGSAPGARFPPGRQLVQLEATMFACSIFSQPTVECEQRILQRRLEDMLRNSTARAAWEAGGLRNVEIALIQPRPLPTAPNASGEWVPANLDRVDQRFSPLDGRYTANASGSGVNVYLLSSGIRPDHEAFGYLDGRPGSRVQGAWGLQGIDPLQDCRDFSSWYGFGTFAASVIGGLKVGAAPNVTLHSLRYRYNCLIDEPASWSNEGLPEGIRWVAANAVKPAVLVVDAWWRPDRFEWDDDAMIIEALTAALDDCYAAGVTVVTLAAGNSCDNPMAAHPGSISVGTAGAVGYTGWGANSSCIDIWAPGGAGLTGAADGLTGAYPFNTTMYRTALPADGGGSFLVGGLAAQYLSKHPEASPDEVRRAMVAAATPHAVANVGPDATTNLVFTNLTDAGTIRPYYPPSPSPAPAPPPSGGGSSSTGTIVAIVVPVAVVAMLLCAGVGYLLAKRYRRQRLEPDDKEWKIDPDQIEICERPDGSPWLLGSGGFGDVFKGVKGKVQEVAVKKLNGQYMNGPQRESFIQEIMLMKYVSRDANVTQFYGACVEPTLMLVVELMEGGDLRGALTADRRGELGWYRRGKSVILDILRGLTFLHDSHVIHRDIKSKNILLTKDGKAKISDVGLAMLCEGEQGGSEGEVCGTFAWAAPELLLGDECSEKADIYSFGVVLWEVVTQEVPVRGCLHDVRVPERCPQEVADAISNCLQSDPTQRPSARELYARLLACPPHNEEYTPTPAEGSVRPSPFAAPAPAPAASLRARSSGALLPGGGAHPGLDVPGRGPSARRSWRFNVFGVKSWRASLRQRASLRVGGEPLEACGAGSPAVKEAGSKGAGTGNSNGVTIVNPWLQQIAVLPLPEPKPAAAEGGPQ